MPEARIPTYVVAYDADEYVFPLGATLTKDRADRLITEVVDFLVEEARRRWQADWEDDHEIRPFDEADTRLRAEERIVITDWKMPFIQTDEETDPLVFRLVVEHEEDHMDSDLFRP